MCYLTDPPLMFVSSTISLFGLGSFLESLEHVWCKFCKIDLIVKIDFDLLHVLASAVVVAQTIVEFPEGPVGLTVEESTTVRLVSFPSSTVQTYLTFSGLRSN